VEMPEFSQEISGISVRALHKKSFKDAIDAAL
jgi:hypothetical protein